MDVVQLEAGGNVGGATRYCFRFRPNGTSNPTVYFGNFITSITYSGTGTGIYLVNFATTHPGLLYFNANVQSNVGGPAQGFTFETDNAQTNTNPTSGGAVVAIAGVNPSGTRATIASDANTMIFCEVVFSENTTLVP